MSSSSLGRGLRCPNRLRFRLSGGGRGSGADGGGHLETERLRSLRDVIFFRLRYLDLVEIAGTLELRDEIRDGINGSRFALKVQRILRPFKGDEPQAIDSNYGVGDHLEEFLPSRAVLLQSFDNVDPLLQYRLLAFELLDFRFDLFEAGLFGPQGSNLLVRGLEVPLTLHIEKEQDHSCDTNSRGQKQGLNGGLQRHRLFCGLGTSLTE